MVVPNHHHRHGASDEWRRFYRKVMTSHHLPQSVPKWPQPRQLSSTRLLPIENADGQALPDFLALPPARPQEPAASNHHHSRQPALYRHKDRETSDQNHTGFDQMFHDLYGGKARVDGYDDDCWRPVLEASQAAKPRNPAALDHPHFQSAKALSMTIDEVEAIWAPIAASDDWSLLADKIAAIHQMRQAYGGDPAMPLPSIIGRAAG